MEWIDGYIGYISSVRRYSPRTVAIYSDILKRYAAFPETGISRDNIRAYELYLLDDCHESPRTVSQHLSVLSGFFKYLLRLGHVSSNPVHLVPKPKQPRRIPEFYREESMREYFESTKGVVEFGRYDAALRRIIVSILFSTGIRRAELISLDRDSVDFGRMTLSVRGKGDKMRSVPLTPTLAGEIRMYLQRLDSLDNADCRTAAPLLQTPSGNRLYPVFVDRAVKHELGTVSDITSRKSPHVLRHTIASELLGDGADLNSIKELLGHSSLAATQVYTHSSVERLKNVYDMAHPRAKAYGLEGKDQNADR